MAAEAAKEDKPGEPAPAPALAPAAAADGDKPAPKEEKPVTVKKVIIKDELVARVGHSADEDFGTLIYILR